jgi:SAM-dependent methyltransferase
LRCSRCGLATFQPQPDPNELANCYSPHYYDSGYEAFRLRRLQEIRRTLQRLLPYCAPPARVLDFGAGLGYYAHELRSSGCDVSLIEPSPHARRVLEEQGFHAATDWRGVSPPFDVILMMDVLGHTLHPSDDLEAAAHALRPGGFLVIRAPYFRGAWRRWEARLAFWKDGAPLGYPTILWRFEPRDLRRALEGHGFTMCRLWMEVQPWSFARSRKTRALWRVSSMWDRLTRRGDEFCLVAKPSGGTRP